MHAAECPALRGISGRSYCMEKEPVVLQMSHISKQFPGVKALQDVSLTLRRGEALALCGENGAGKSTLMKVLCGLYAPDSADSQILYQGKPVRFRHPIEAKKAGIIMVFQELSLILDLSVAENIYMGMLPEKHGRIDWKKANEDAARVLRELECDIDPRTHIRRLSVAQRQMIEIARGIALQAKILILDEPTSSLTNREKDILFQNIRMLKKKGVSIIYISHKMEEITEICDQALVLRDGQVSGFFDSDEMDINAIIRCMIGRSISNYYEKTTAVPGEEILRLEHLSRAGEYQDISLRVRRGEVVGLYGLVGAGRTELVQSIFGLTRPDSGTIYYKGRPARLHSSADAVRLKIGYVPENRKEEGLVLSQSCRQNISLAMLPSLRKNGMIQEKAIDALYEEFRQKLQIHAPGADQPVENLSGGNQQKIVLGKWLATKPELLILDEPTRGIDIGAKSEIHRLIAALAEEGMAVLLISSEMPEIMGVSTRLVTIREGKLTAELEGDQITAENIINAIMLEQPQVKS